MKTKREVDGVRRRGANCNIQWERLGAVGGWGRECLAGVLRVRDRPRAVRGGALFLRMTGTEPVSQWAGRKLRVMLVKKRQCEEAAVG